MTTSRLKAGPTSETLFMLNTPHKMDNAQFNISIMNQILSRIFGESQYSSTV